MTRGAFITVEGSDGAGKSTHLEFLNRWLRNKGVDVVTTREPGGTKLGEALRKILLDLNEKDDQFLLADETELMLMFAARMQHLHELILPALADGRWILCDRFTDATYAYQGGGRGIEDNRIAQLEDWVQREVQPDLTILFDVPVDIGLSRTTKRGHKADRFEREQIKFKQAVRNKYLSRAAEFPKRVKVIDASGEISEIQTDLETCLSEFYEKHLTDVT